ncbi:D-alanyl-D-alanine carboxypeptidase/D-alanyl-D-alanine endopeptidase [Murinocardiopsis flavida]|uniref:D-alanyl-D-alanine carboxypeptidase/D-alanyl-D-alanine endopeptidase n=1 Tax=Murinocardiopsis flavida TaxID=645275 RepID=UPI00318342A1
MAAVVAGDIIGSRPPETTPFPVAAAEEAPAPAATDAPEAEPDRLADRLNGPMSRSGISDGLSGYVADAATGDRLYDLDAGKGLVPASTTKIVSAVSVLHSAGPDERVETRVYQGGSAGEIILKGFGDPTLTETVRPDEYPRVATLQELAQSTARELRAAGVESVRLGYDDTFYPGPDMAPGWKQGYIDEGSAATVHALMLDGGRTDRLDHYSERVGDPPKQAADAFARQLDEAGVAVEGGPSAAEVPKSEKPIASVSSAPISALVEKMLVESDNNVAEALVRQVAIAEGKPPSFKGGSEAVESVMAQLKIPDVKVSDGSGLSVRNDITPKALVDLLLLSADPKRPDLHYTLTGLPIANFTGTLTDRYSEESGSGAGAGLVRAKTGTLNGVSTLAGVAYDAEGRLLVFAFMANDPAAAGSALDTFAAAIAQCGCS